MTIHDILFDLRWHRITEVVAVEQLEQLGKEIRERTIDEIQEIVNDALDHESSLSDTERGHMRSMHVGAMDALGGIMDEILKLKGKQ